MRSVFLIGCVAGLVLVLSACASTPPRPPAALSAANHGDVSSEEVAVDAQERYAPEPGVTYDQPVAFPDNPTPIYPPSLLPRALAPVVVTVTIVVSGEGTVSDVVPADPVEGADAALFVDSVRAALTQWKFFPLVKVVKGGPKTVVTVGDVETTYDGQARRMPFSQRYRFTFSQASGVPSVGESFSEIVR